MLGVTVTGRSRWFAAQRVVEDRHPIAAETTRRVSTGRWAWEWTKSILVAFALFLVIRKFLVEAFRIPTGSMEDTLLVGDFLLVNKAVYGSRVPLTTVRLPGFGEPKRGDIIVFVPPHEPGKNYVKRVLGLPGDTIEMRDKELFVNGRRHPERYVRHTDANDTYSSQMHWQCDYLITDESRACRPMRDNWGPLVVPADRYLVLGDNRDDSEDSRYWGFVERDAIRGRPLFIYYSFDPGQLRPLPWLTQIRWARIGNTLN